MPLKIRTKLAEDAEKLAEEIELDKKWEIAREQLKKWHEEEKPKWEEAQRVRAEAAAQAAAEAARIAENLALEERVQRADVVRAARQDLLSRRRMPKAFLFRGPEDSATRAVQEREKELYGKEMPLARRKFRSLCC